MVDRDGLAAAADVFAAAVEYAQAGHPVFPVWSVRPDGSCHCELGASCKNAGKHPHGRLAPRGCLDATDDVARVEAWWRQYPQANVAIATGSSVVVVDGDRKGDADGVAAFLRLAEVRGGLPETATVDTGGGGAHFYFAADPDVPVRCQQDALVDGEHVRGIDVRGVGGYVVAPPSLHKSGRRYAWARGIEHLVAAPPWLVQLLAVPGPDLPTRAATPLGSSLAARVVPPDVAAQLESALEKIPPNTGRLDWVERVSMPIHDAYGGSEDGFRLWHEWCKRGQGLLTPNGNPAYGGEKECRRVWKSFSALHRNPKGLPTLFEFAGRHGWAPARPGGRNGPAAAASSPPSNGHAEAAAPPGYQPPPQFDPEELAAALAGPRDPGPFPVSIVHGLEGPISELCCWILNCSRRPDPAIAFTAALGVAAAALGRRVVGPAGTRTPLAIACLAPSGAGKDLPIACLKNVLASRPELSVGLLDDSPTHRAQLDELLLKKRGQVVLVLDEYGATLRRWLSSTDPTSGSMSPALRRLTTHGEAVYHLAPVSMRHPARAASPAAWDAGVFAPAVSLIGFATPGQFYEALNEASLVDGFLGRHVVIGSDSPADLRTPPDKPTTVPGPVLSWLASVETLPVPATDRAAAILAAMGPRTATDVPVVPADPVAIPWSDDATQAAYDGVVRAIDAAAHEAIRQGDEPGTAVLRRLPGQVATLSLLLACGETMPAGDATIGERHVVAALRIARWSADHLSWRLRRGAATDDVGRAHVRVCEAIERAGGRKVYLSVLAGKAWLAPHALRVWKLVMLDPRFVATEKWAALRAEPASQAAAGTSADAAT